MMHYLGVGTIVDNDVNIPPRAVNDSSGFGGPLPQIALHVLDNDTDANGDSLSIYSVTQPPGGNTQIVGDTVVFQPDAEFFSLQRTSFYYVASDNHGGLSSPAKVTIAAPLFKANDDTALTLRGVPVDIPVSANDTGYGRVLRSITQPAHGSVRFSDHGSIIYTPDPSYTQGPDGFDYTIGNSYGETSTAHVTVNVVSYTVINTAFSQTTHQLQFDMVDWNADFHVDLVVIDKSGDSGRTEVSILDGATNFQTYLWQRPTWFLRTDGPGERWTFKIVNRDGDGYWDLVGIKSANTPNSKTEVHFVSGSTQFTQYIGGFETALPISGDTVEYEMVDWDRNGTADLLGIDRAGASGHTELSVVNGSTSFSTFFPGFNRYATGLLNTGNEWDFEIPDWDDNGQYDLVGIKQRFTGQGLTEMHGLTGATSFQSFFMQVATALPETGEEFTFKILNYNATAPKDLIAIRASGAASGKVQVQLPFLQSTDAVALQAFVDPRHPPAALPDSASIPFGTQAIVNVLANDGDPDSDQLSISAVNSPNFGTAVALNEGTILYTPNPGFSGVDSFLYTITDGEGGYSTAAVQVTVANGAPAAGDDVLTRPRIGSVSIPVLTNDFDSNSDPLTVTLVTAPGQGAVSISGDNVVYTPNGIERGPDEFTYTISDGHGGTSVGRVVLLVPGPGDANGDGVVGAADYAIWAAQFGQSGAGLIADFDGNGSVGAGDYALWAARFGGGATGAAPAPQSAPASRQTVQPSADLPRKAIVAATDHVLTRNEVWDNVRLLLRRFAKT